MLGHVGQQVQGLHVAAGRGADHLGQTRRRHGGIGLGVGIRQAGRVVEAAQDGVRNDLVLLVQTVQDTRVTPALYDGANGLDQFTPAVFGRAAQHRIQLRQVVAVMAAANHQMDQARVSGKDLLMGGG